MIYSVGAKVQKRNVRVATRISYDVRKKPTDVPICHS